MLNHNTVNSFKPTPTVTTSLSPGVSEHLEITVERKELRRYSVWEQQEMEAHELHFKCDEEPTPPAALLLCVSETAAAAIQRELLQLCVTHDETTGKKAHTVDTGSLRS